MTIVSRVNSIRFPRFRIVDSIRSICLSRTRFGTRLIRVKVRILHLSFRENELNIVSIRENYSFQEFKFRVYFEQSFEKI